MLTVKFKKTYEIPSRWHELDNVRFISLCAALHRFESGKTEFDRFRLEVVAALLKISLRNMKITDTLTENFFRISEQLTFPYTIIDDGNRRTVNFSIILDRQMVPSASRRSGYIFSLKDGMVDTSLTAEQYVDAVSLMQLYSSDPKPSILNQLFAVLYAGQPYSKQTVKAVRPHAVPERYKIAAYYNFRGILEWIRRLPKYDLIFNHSGDRPTAGSSPMGAEGSLYSLAKSGYGSYNEICKLGIFEYLDLLLQQTIESIRQLKGCGLEPTKIAEKTNLSVEQISSVL